MSEEQHPNLNAAGLASDITQAFAARIRGDAAKDIKSSLDVFGELVVDFINRLSSDLDKRFEN